MSNEFPLNVRARGKVRAAACVVCRRTWYLYGEAEPQMITAELRELKALENEAFWLHPEL